MNQDIQNQYTLHQKNGVAWKVPLVITNQTKFILKKRKYTQINRTHLVHESRYWKLQTFFAKKKQTNKHTQVVYKTCLCVATLNQKHTQMNQTHFDS